MGGSALSGSSLSLSANIASFSPLFSADHRTRRWNGEKPEGARGESSEYMHYVSYPTVKKTALRVGTRGTSGAPGRMRCMIMSQAHSLEGTSD